MGAAVFLKPFQQVVHLRQKKLGPVLGCHRTLCVIISCCRAAVLSKCIGTLTIADAVSPVLSTHCLHDALVC